MIDQDGVLVHLIRLIDRIPTPHLLHAALADDPTSTLSTLIGSS
jgi:hypothetical protein